MVISRQIPTYHYLPSVTTSHYNRKPLAMTFQVTILMKAQQP
jgi:hypothetical protein